MARHAVVIVGGGPTGLMLAAELALAKVAVVIVERRATQDVAGTRSRGLHARTIEILDMRGVADRFLAEGKTAQVAGFGWNPLDISDQPTRHNYGLALTQYHFERILSGWVEELGVPLLRSREVTGFTQDAAGVEVQLSDGQTLRAEYLVGCDGGRSLVRKTAGIEFAGWDPTASWLIGEVEFTEPPPFGMRRDAHGIHALTPAETPSRLSVLVTEQELRSSNAGEPSIHELREALRAIFGSDFGAHRPHWLSRFTDAARQAVQYRKGRVLLAGDAAHVHHPVGGQGLNTGVQDAVNLGWKLAQVVKGTSPEALLDTYHSERHPVGARVLRNSLAQTELLRRNDDRAKALSDTFAELLSMDEPRRRFGAMMSGLGIRYELGDVQSHPLLGRRMPDLDLRTNENDDELRVFSLLRDARPVLLNLDPSRAFDAAPLRGRGLRTVDARYDGRWELPGIGNISAPSSVLIRPDGHVAWVGDGTDRGLTDALNTWFGAAHTA